MIPLLKKPSLPKDDPANYRPITNLSTFSKLLEKLAAVRVRPQVITSRHFSSFQSAYRPGYSTETALQRVVSDIRLAAGDGKCTMLLALDISAAFDSLNHDVLCSRLESTFGLSGAVLTWFKSFLSNRSQYVAIEDMRSSTKNLSSGVPQGSVLGPLLFSLYVSEVSEIIESLGIRYHQYADDLMIYLPLSCNDDDLNKLSDASKVVQRWFLENFLLLNPSKTEAIVFGTRQRLNRIKEISGIDVANDHVNFVDHVKFLGVTLDTSLTFDKHISALVRDCSYHTRALRQIRPFLTVESSNMVASAIVGSRLDYCNSLLNSVTDFNIRRLQTVQNNLARVVMQAARSCSITQLREYLHWLPVRERIRHKTATLTFKADKMCIPGYLNEDLEDYRPCRNLRSSSEFLLQERPFSSEFSSGAFYSVAPKEWNSLPLNVRQAQSLSTFKTTLKTELFKIAYKIV